MSSIQNEVAKNFSHYHWFGPEVNGEPPMDVSSESSEMERRLWALFDGVSFSPELPKDPAQIDQSKVSQLGKICIDKLSESEQEDGRIVDIGKFLLDPDCVDIFERIISSKHVSKFVRTVSEEHAAVLDRLQNYLVKQQGVRCTIVIGHDGAVMSSLGAEQAEIEGIASWALCAYVNSRIAAQLVGAQQLKHLVLSSSSDTVILSDFGPALLISLANAEDNSKVMLLTQTLDALLA